MRNTLTQRRTTKAFAGVVAASALVLTGCGDSAGPEAGAVTTEDLQELEERVGVLEEGVGGLEEEVAGLGAVQPIEPEAGADAGAGVGESVDEGVIGEEVTVSAEVTGVIDVVGSGAAFWIGGGNGQEVPVFTPQEPENQVEPGNVVRVTGTAIGPLNPGLFEEEVGVADEEFFSDPDAFWGEAEGRAGVVADNVELLQAQSSE